MAGSVVSRSAADASARGVKRPAEELTAGITFQESVEAFAKEQEPQQLVPLGVRSICVSVCTDVVMLKWLSCTLGNP